MPEKFFHKKNTYKMDMETANQTLQNIFATCETPPNTVPFDKLVLRQKAYTKGFFCFRCITFLSLMLVFVSPILFYNATPNFTIESSQHENMDILDHYIENSHFHIFVSGSALALEDSYITDINGTVYPVESYDNSTGEVVLPYPGGEINIFLSEPDNQYMQIILTPKK